jgi:hypothetical protein
MKIQAAVVKEQGQTFAVVVVKRSVIDVRQRGEETLVGLRRYFPRMPIVLMAQDGRGIPTYLGRPDIVRFLSKISFQRLPWKEFTFSQAA